MPKWRIDINNPKAASMLLWEIEASPVDKQSLVAKAINLYLDKFTVADQNAAALELTGSLRTCLIDTQGVAGLDEASLLHPPVFKSAAARSSATPLVPKDSKDILGKERRLLEGRQAFSR